MAEVVAYVMIGLIVLAYIIYEGYKRTLECDVKKAELRGQNAALQELKRQVETLQAIVTASDYEARRRLMAHLPPTDVATSPAERTMSGRMNAEG
jgi:hypothetical protein